MNYRSSTRLFLYIALAVYGFGYVFRYLFISYYIAGNVMLPAEYAEWYHINLSPLTSGFFISSIIFGIFVTLFLVTFRPAPVEAPRYQRITAFTMVALTILLAASLVLRYLFGAKLGQDVALVGFFTGTLNYRIQADLLPALILLFMEIAWLAGQRGRYLFGMALLAGFYLVLSAITTSKAGMVFFLMQVIILMYLTGQSIWKYPVRLTLAAVGGVLTFIGASQLRAQALGIGDSAIWVSLKDGYIVETLFQVVGLIANRIPGVEGVALTCGLSCDTLLAFQMPTFDRGPIDIYTYDIVGVLGTADFRSPGLIAGAIILAGLYGGAAIVLAALMVGKSACNQMDRYKFSAATRAAFLFGMLRFMMEGAWNWVDIASMLAGVMAVEAIARAWRVKPVQQIAPVIKSGTYNFV